MKIIRSNNRIEYGKFIMVWLALGVACIAFWVLTIKLVNWVFI
jgi:hypothetical protein